MRIYLAGFMGAGKSTVGESLAGLLAWRFVDLDREIEKAAGLRVREIFERRGEPAFRGIEQEVLRRLSELERAVIATGGGTLAVAANRELIARSGVSVWLDLPFESLCERIGGVPSWERPLFRDEAQARALYLTRLPGYRSCDLHVAVTAEETPRQLAARIGRSLEEHGCAI